MLVIDRTAEEPVERIRSVGFGSSMTRPARLSSTSSSHPASSGAGLMARLCARGDAPDLIRFRGHSPKGGHDGGG